MKVMLKPKSNKSDTFNSRLNYIANDYMLNTIFYLENFQTLPLAFDLKYNTDADYLPIDMILYGSDGIICKEKGSATATRKTFLEILDTRVSTHRSFKGVDRNDWRTIHFIKDGIVYKNANDVVTPMVGLFIKNNTTNRISLKKDVALNKAVNSAVFNIPIDSVLFIHPDCLQKGTSAEKLFGTYCRKMLKTYGFIQSTGDMSIFDGLFKHKIKEPRGFAEFEQFNSTVNTHLKEVLDEIYE